MKFIDPSPVTCPQCSAESWQRVADLFQLVAICPHCNCLLREVGQEMRELCDRFGDYVYVIEIAMEVERKIGKTIPDEVLEKVLAGSRTLRDLVHGLRNDPSLAIDSEAQAFELAQGGTSEIAHRELEPDWLKKRICDLIAPYRWSKEGILQRT